MHSTHDSRKRHAPRDPAHPALSAYATLSLFMMVLVVMLMLGAAYYFSRYSTFPVAS